MSDAAANELWHGKSVGYNYRRCRCESCREYNRTRQLASRARRRRGETKMPVPHGLGGYRNYDCRCEVCVAANSAACSAYRARRSP